MATDLETTGTALAEAVAPSRHSVTGLVHRWRNVDAFRKALCFPLLVMLGFIVLVAMGVSGSSMDAVRGGAEPHPQVLFGQAKQIRSDEWNVRTPLLLSQAAQGLPARVENGVGSADAAVLYYLPTSDWSMVFKPQLWGFLILPAPQAFAFDWWGSALVLLLGVYAFLLVVFRNWGWAALGALAVFSAPMFHWWYIPASLSVVGFTAGAFAAMLIALRLSPRRWWLSAWSAASGALFVCAALLLYPPFQIASLFVFGAVTIAVILSRPGGRLETWKPVALVVCIAGAVVVVVLGAFVVQHRDALHALSSSLYPGRRRSEGGAGLPWQLLTNSWFSWLVGRDPITMSPMVQLNASEDSSFPMLGLFLLPSLPFVWRGLTEPGTQFRRVLLALCAVLGVFAAHVYIGLPPFIAKITLLDRVPTRRALLGIGLASMLVLLTVAVTQRQAHLTIRRRLVAAGAFVVVTGLYVASFGRWARVVGAPVSLWIIGVTCLAATVITASFYFWPRLSVALMVVVGMMIAAWINPLYSGLQPLRGSETANALRQIAASTSASPDARWLSTSGNLQPVLTANGFRSVSGVSLYPDASAWRILDPEAEHIAIWSRYANMRWRFESDLAEPRLTSPSADVVEVAINPCDPRLVQLGVRYIADVSTVRAKCWVPIGEVVSPAGERVRVSEISVEALQAATSDTAR